jgi:hypothetical protein
MRFPRLLRHTASRLSPAARIFLATLPRAQSHLIAADVAHLERHPDPAGDASGLRFSLRLAQRPARTSLRGRIMARWRSLGAA